MKFKVSSKTRRYISIFTLIFHIYIFTKIGIHYFEQKAKMKQRALIENTNSNIIP
ncbi:MAG: hypothetical protein R3Y38_03315 [Rikenellaceae bacterium]